MTDQNEMWVFGYGSLMWRPGFDYLEAQPATLPGYHRDLCVLSYVYRGTPEVPGLVMGLNPGGHCAGRAFRVARANQQAVIAYLDQREMINQVYEPTWVDVTLGDDRQVQAYTFVAVRDHDQYVGHLGQADKLIYLCQGVGRGGTSLQYLENTCAHLRELGIHDGGLEEILQAAQQEQA